ncbi:transcription factor bHLH131-like, partial [Juglans microcarpa x Juglans regia]|uniref:transcription factor bHLH131-like n=1 Tax=Juglans microcarpa x Juglans regia TaxID=2249226 RepID=UPI001B7F2DC4
HGQQIILQTKIKSQTKQLNAKKHGEAERRRRRRINDQYHTLHKILPSLIKVRNTNYDKATVLAETVRQVTELRKTASDLEAVCDGSNKDCMFPCEADKLTLEHCDDDWEAVMVMFSCEDRPGLMSAMERALRSVQGVTSEMVTVGGRTKSVLWVQGLNGGNAEGIVKLRRALKGDHRQAHLARDREEATARSMNLQLMHEFHSSRYILRWVV